MEKLIRFGESVPGYTIPVLNEREVRAAAGILFLLTYSALLAIIFKGYFLNSGTEEYTLQSITANLSEDDMNELEDYVSNDYLELISGKDEFILPAEFDFSMEAMLTDVSPEEKVMIMSDYHINEIYSLVDEEEFEIAYKIIYEFANENWHFSKRYENLNLHRNFFRNFPRKIGILVKDKDKGQKLTKK